MNWPSSQDYNEAIQNAATAASDPDLKSGQVTVNAMGLPVPRSGNFADVYQFKGGDGTMWAIKCFTRHVEGLQERYTKINQYLERAQLPFTVGFKYLEEGLRIRGKWYPLLKMEWVEGFTLNEFVRENADKPNYLHGLLQMWAKLTGKLRDANIAHADLQHGNVLLVPGNTPAKLGLKLIDYDGMWVPTLADYHSGEVGHPNFQHPLRLKERLFNADVDRFAHLVIACALRATLVGGKSFWNKYDNGDNLLFREQDLREPENSAVFKSLWDLNDNIVRTLIGNIALSSKQPLRKTPWLDDLLLEEAGPRLSADQEKQTVAMLGVAPPAAKAAKPAAAAEEYGAFEAIEEDDEEPATRLRAEDDEERERRARRRSRKSAKGQKGKKQPNLPLLIGGGVGALALIVLVLVLALGGRRKPPVDPVSEPVAENIDKQERPKPKRPPAEPKDPSLPKEKDDPAPKKPSSSNGVSWRNAITGLATIAGSKRYLFTSKDDPALWIVDEGNKPPKELGRHEAPIKALACSSDGNTAITGDKDGLVRILPIPMVDFAKIDSFKGDYGFVSYQNSIVMHNNATGKEERVVAGKPGQALKGGFKNTYESRNLKPRMGEALTEEVDIFGKAMIVQIFEGGTMLFERQSNLIWYVFHGRRRPAPEKGDLKQHTKAVVACDISRDGMRAVSIGEDNLLCHWDLAERKLLGSFPIPASSSIVFLDANRVLIGSASESADIWDLNRRQPVKELPGHTGGVRAVCVSQDGKIAATGGNEGLVRVWDVESGALRHSLDRAEKSLVKRGEKGPIKGMSMTPDGQFLISAQGALGYMTWNIQQGSMWNGGLSHTDQLQSVSFFTVDGGQSFVFGWETPSGGGRLELIKLPLPVSKSPPVRNPDSPRPPPDSPKPSTGLLTLLKEASAELTNQRGFAKGRTVIREDGKYFCQLSPIQGGGTDMRVMDGADGNEVGDVHYSGNEAADVLFGPNSQFYMLTNDGQLDMKDLLNFRTGAREPQFRDEKKKQEMQKLLPTSNPRRFLVGGAGPSLLLWDVIGWKQAARATPQPAGTYFPRCSFPDGKRAVLHATGNGRSELVIWNHSIPGSGKVEHTLGKIPPGMNLNEVTFLEVSPNGKWIVGHREDQQALGQFFFWDAATGELLGVKPNAEASHQFIGFDPSGDFLIYQTAQGGPVHALDLKERKVVSETEPMQIVHGAISRSGTVVSLDLDRKTRFWRLDLPAK